MDKPKCARCNERQADENAALIAELPGNQAGGDGHQEIGQIVGGLHQAGLFLVDVEGVLEMLVEDVNHPVAKAPEQEQRSDQDEGD